MKAWQQTLLLGAGFGSELLWVWGNLAVGVLLLVCAAALSFDALRERMASGEARRAGRYGSSAVASTLLLIAILGMLAFLIAIGASAAAQFYWVSGGGLLLFGAVGLGIWEFLDWRNDFYLVTSLRVVWLEQVLLRSSSRTEAPLPNIQSVNVHSSLMGRLLGFGDVIVRTYTTISQKGGQLKLVNLTKRITDLLSLTKLLTVFETFDSEAEALKSFS